ncbi:hypothetical protein A7T58_20630 [Salmonella enterica subsp. diarizonae serovar 16:z10:e,n,x,z15]|uniref:Uncharacterized protein n=1 Tax=Salmonella enterica TaxID=28901 RepID=A0A3F3J0B3_SALER|nr:hypothetical protein A7T58_20630 [Salmonella enterica subsp. diarizonae serovar 16:z10:e,n,x,z15]OHG34840.1 hypothetical protein A7T60_19410 [Salmonella enterica subsp. diarizonae serovar 16:z10:e,n,x,z15]OHJ49093.1 hypothetical protein A7S51_20715 [Salmonella enterica]OHK45690.1 hypothetical protein A7S73_18310 [Salmonella enterica subsp. enterica serovar Mbandaka]OHK68792.1 hypothetical protein A7S80_18765 [Salmonella enterica subsp. enterica serovar Mbandaka]
MQNQWQLWGHGNNRKMVCSLTGSHLAQGIAVNLTASRRFITCGYGNSLNSSKVPTIPPDASRKSLRHWRWNTIHA